MTLLCLPKGRRAKYGEGLIASIPVNLNSKARAMLRFVYSKEAIGATLFSIA